MKNFLLLLSAVFLVTTGSAQKNTFTSRANNHFEVNINNGNNKQKLKVKTIAAMQNTNSAYYQSQVLSKLIDVKMKDEAEWSKLIGYTGKIKSDYSQAEVLQKIAGNMPQSESLKKELETAALNIKSDYYYGKVAREMKG